MQFMRDEYKRRIHLWVETLKSDLYEPLGEITWKACRTNENLSPEQALAGVFTPAGDGFTWGNEWEYCWFYGNITLPEQAEGKRIVLNLNPGGESTLFVNGESFGTYRSDLCNVIFEKIHYIQDNTITRNGKCGERFDILMETYAGHFIPQREQGCIYGPVLGGNPLNDSLEKGKRCVLGKCSYGIWNEEAYQLYLDVVTLGRLLEVIDRTTLRAAKIEEALEKFTLTVDFEQGKENRQKCYAETRKMLEPLLYSKNGSTVPEFYAIGNGHIDMAWLWPMDETCRKTARTFSAQLRLMDEYPDYKFIQSQPALYEMCREHYPQLFERIKQAVKNGQWIADGGMWVEPDTNMSGGEALIRQILYGKNYYKKEFNVDSEVLWLPDTFGYTAALPQILKGCGMKYLVTQKIFWSYDGIEQFPYHYFNWEGMDGSKIVSFLPTSYTYRTNPAELINTWRSRRQERDMDAFLLPFGYGDGGGGPCRDHIEYALREKNLEGCPRVKIAGPKEFFEDMGKNGGPKNTYVGELYFSAHRGTYTSQALMKRNNRKAEIIMRELELWSVIANTKGYEYPKYDIEKLWKTILLHQFHDILPGSCIKKVYDKAEKVFEGLFDNSNKLIKEAQSIIAERSNKTVSVFNSLGFSYEALVELPNDFKYGGILSNGDYIHTDSDSGTVKALIKLPSCGAVSLKPADKRLISEDSNVTVVKNGSLFVMENSFVKAMINRQGQIISYVLKESNREFAKGILNEFHIYKDVPRIFDAWDIDSNYRQQEITEVFSADTVVEAQGIEGVLCVRGKLNNSTLVQKIRLAKNSKRLVFETEIDWNELHKLLKVSFPVNVYSENVINEIQFGYVERPTHRSKDFDKDRFEVCNHKYSALCDAHHGAAIINDCKYGMSANGNSLELTLLRAAASPDFRADNRVHRFTYAFTAWEGTFYDCDVVKQAYEINVKPTMLTDGKTDFSFMQIENENIMLESVKLAEDGSGDIIARFYESKKSSVKSNIKIASNNCSAFICDMMENIIEEIPIKNEMISVSFRAFEIKTIRFKIYR